MVETHLALCMCNEKRPHDGVRQIVVNCTVNRDLCMKCRLFTGIHPSSEPISHVTYRISHFTYRISQITYRRSHNADRISLIAYRVSHIISQIAYHLSHIAYHISYCISYIAYPISHYASVKSLLKLGS